MGMFGPTEEEARLAAQLSEEKARANALGEQLGHSRNLLQQSQVELERTKALAHISEVAEDAMRQAEQSGDVQIGAAQTALQVTKERYVHGAEGVLADQLITEQQDALRVKHGPEWDNEIRGRLKLQFERDGTFRRIEGEVDAEAIKTIADTMRTEISAAREEFNASPERQQELRDEAKRQLQESGEADRIRALRDEEARHAFEEAALDELHREIDEEERQREAEFKDTWKKRWRESTDGRYYIESIREKLQRKWKGAASEEVAQEIQDQELQRLLGERAEREKTKLRGEAFYDDHLATFSGSGIDVQKLPQDCSVTIYLGKVEISKSVDRYNSTREDGRRVAANRIIRLTKLDDGRFRVEYDSMHESESPYEVAAALKYGEVIHIGRKVVDKGVVSLDPTIRQDVPLFTDDDTSDPHITPTHLPVANVEVNGLSAVKDLKPARIVQTVYQTKN